MTQDELIEVARIKGLIRWENTGTVEFLRLVVRQKGKRQIMLAHGRFTEIHYLFTVGGNKKDLPFRCEPIASTDPRIGSKEDQREAARKTPYFKEPQPKKNKPRRANLRERTNG